MKNLEKILIFILLITLTTVCVGCNKEEKEDTNYQEGQKLFTKALERHDWQVDIMGVTGTIEFGDGSGVITIDGHGTYDFDYALSDVASDGKSATVTITNSGIDQVDGQQADVKIVDGAVEVNYWGMDYVLPPVE